MVVENSEKLWLYMDIYNVDKYIDENVLFNVLLMQLDVFFFVFIYFVGCEDKWFLLSFLIEGMGYIFYVNDVEYDFFVIGWFNKSVLCIKLVFGMGVNFIKICLVFKEKWFNKGYFFEDFNGIQYWVVGEQFEGEDGWIYIL